MSDSHDREDLQRRIDELEESSRDHARFEEALARINECFLGFGTDPVKNIGGITALCGNLLDGDFSLYSRLEEKGLRILGKWNAPDDLDTLDTANGRICRDVIRWGGEQVFVVRDLARSHYAVSDPHVLRHGLETYVGHAVKCDGSYVGSLCVVYRRDVEIDDIRKKILGILASAAGNEESRLRAVHTIREGEEYYRLLVESIQEGLGIVDGDENIIFANRPWCQILGYTRDEVMGKNLKEVMPPESFRQIRDETDKRKKGLSSVYEIKVRTRDGEFRDIRVSAVPWSNGSGRFVGTIGSVLDITDQKRASAQIAATSDKLRKAVEGTIQAIASVTELRDPYTAGHQRRVAELASAIAREMDLTRDVIDGIFLVGLIHDIGKIYVPAEILSKPGRLTSVEFDMIKAHAIVGYDILKNIEFPWPIADVVVQHHERLNGSGYPNGLKDDDIIRDARIVAVADVVEAMASHRPYRPALGIEAALKEIREHSGVLYDPDVVRACLDLFETRGFTLD
jgi:PAS domain S-box-containing protein/putative nucleotidyltransferase with HDIG domain